MNYPSFDPQGRVCWGEQPDIFGTSFWFDTSASPTIALKLHLGAQEYATIGTMDANDPNGTFALSAATGPAAAALSSDAGNLITDGNPAVPGDSGAFLDASAVLSAVPGVQSLAYSGTQLTLLDTMGGVHTVTIDPQTDHISADADNLLVMGADGLAYLSASAVMAAFDPSLLGPTQVAGLLAMMDFSTLSVAQVSQLATALSGAMAASDIANDSGVTGANVKEALDDLNGQILSLAGSVSDDQLASEVPITAPTGYSGTNVQDIVVEIVGNINGLVQADVVDAGNGTYSVTDTQGDTVTAYTQAGADNAIASAISSIPGASSTGRLLNITTISGGGTETASPTEVSLIDWTITPTQANSRFVIILGTSLVTRINPVSPYQARGVFTLRKDSSTGPILSEQRTYSDQVQQTGIRVDGGMLSGTFQLTDALPFQLHVVGYCFTSTAGVNALYNHGIVMEFEA